MRLYYKIANSISFRIYVHGLERADKVQECVMKAWLALGPSPSESLTPLIYKIMKNHLISLSRPTYAERKLTIYNVDVAMLAGVDNKIIIPLPPDNPERTIVVAWLENDCRLRLACRALGWEYRHGLGIWHQATDIIKAKGLEACYLEEDQCLLKPF